MSAVMAVVAAGFATLALLLLVSVMAHLNEGQARRRPPLLPPVQFAGLRKWRATFEAVGVSDIQEQGNQVRGTRGSRSVALTSHSEVPEEAQPLLVLSVGNLGWGGNELSLQERRRAPGGVAELTLGDPGFERWVALHGDKTLALALLDAATRQQLSDLVGGSVPVPGADGIDFQGHAEFRFGELRLNLYDAALLRAPSDQEPAALLRAVLAVAERLERPRDVAGRLAANANTDPLPAVRLANLRALLGLPAPAPTPTRALQAALADTSEAVRLLAASRLGPAGRDTLNALARQATSDATRADAVRALGAALSSADGLQILELADREAQRATALACLELLPYKGGPEVLAGLAARLLSNDVELAAAAAKALGETGDAAAEPALVESLRDERLAVVTATARALGKLGSAAAVLPLQHATERHRNGDFRLTVKSAVAAIQGRLVGAGSGQLSLATGAQGQLSLADDAHGSVSLTDPADLAK